MTTSCKRPIIFIINDIGALSLCIIIIEHPGAGQQCQIPQYLTFSTSLSQTLILGLSLLTERVALAFYTLNKCFLI